MSILKFKLVIRPPVVVGLSITLISIVEFVEASTHVVRVFVYHITGPNKQL